MDRFKYEIYDYCNIGLKMKTYYNSRMVSHEELTEMLKRFDYDSKRAAESLFDEMRKKLFKENENFNYDPNWVIFYVLVTPETTHRFYETSGKKK